jgi:proteasome lid subunit RPN8/RPN11
MKSERRLIIGQYLLQCILEHCLEEKPYEACGNSHPTAPALPSLNDVNQAVHFPQAIRVIISLNGPTAVQAFHIQNGKTQDDLKPGPFMKRPSGHQPVVRGGSMP